MTRYRERSEAGEFEAEAASAASGANLGSMSKAEMLAYAQKRGVSPANNAMSKDELRAAIEAHEGS